MVTTTPSAAEGLTAPVTDGLQRGLLRCPDCMGVLMQADATVRCSRCNTAFSTVGGALDLRPRQMRSAAMEHVTATDAEGSLSQKFVARVYARHNSSRNVRDALARFWASIPAETIGLNIGSGSTRLHGRAINLDISPASNVSLLADAAALPFVDRSMGWIVSQEVFEHLPDPFQAAREASRVLAKGGLMYLQVPFIIGFHSLPHDYYRFTSAGIRELLRGTSLQVREIGASVGAGTSAYRILSELVPAIASSLGMARLYKPVKAASALLFSPLRLFDLLSPENAQLNRIHAGYYVIAEQVA